jgi:hypothetical protein
MRFCNIDVDSKYDQIREISTDEEELHKKNWLLSDIFKELDSDKIKIKIWGKVEHQNCT